MLKASALCAERKSNSMEFIGVETTSKRTRVEREGEASRKLH